MGKVWHQSDSLASKVSKARHLKRLSESASKLGSQATKVGRLYIYNEIDSSFVHLLSKSSSILF